jgi:hypothetical protein
MEAKLKAKGWKARQEQLRGQPINPLWHHITNSAEMCDATANVVKRLAEKYPHAIFHGAKDADDLVQKAFCYQGEERSTDSTRREKRRRQSPAQSSLIKTFVQKLIAEAVKVSGKPDALNDMASFAGEWSGHLCNPAGRSRPKGTGVYEQLHAELRELINQSENGRHWIQREQALASAVQPKDSSDSRKQLRTAVETARTSVISDSALATKVCERVQELAQSRAAENAEADHVQRRVEIANALKSPDRQPTDSDEAIREKVNKEFAISEKLRQGLS